MIKNRAIEFRVWDRKTKSFLTNDGGCFKSKDYLYSLGSILNEGYKEEYVNLVVQQFTGLLDKKGKKIFEGDLIKFKTHKEALIGYNKQYRYRVVWHEDEAAFVVADSGDGSYFNRFSDMYNIEVIGNIFETPKFKVSVN